MYFHSLHVFFGQLRSNILLMGIISKRYVTIFLLFVFQKIESEEKSITFSPYFHFRLFSYNLLHLFCSHVELYFDCFLVVICRSPFWVLNEIKSTMLLSDWKWVAYQNLWATAELCRVLDMSNKVLTLCFHGYLGVLHVRLDALSSSWSFNCYSPSTCCSSHFPRLEFIELLCQGVDCHLLIFAKFSLIFKSTLSLPLYQLYIG